MSIQFKDDPNSSAFEQEHTWRFMRQPENLAMMRRCIAECENASHELRQGDEFRKGRDRLTAASVLFVRRNAFQAIFETPTARVPLTATRVRMVLRADSSIWKVAASE